MQKLQQYSTIQKIQWNGTATVQDITEIPQKLTNRINIQYVNSNSGYVPKRFEKWAEKNKHISTLIFTAALFTQANKWKEPKCPWTDSSINNCGIHTVKWNKPDRKKDKHSVMLLVWDSGVISKQVIFKDRKSRKRFPAVGKSWCFMDAASLGETGLGNISKNRYINNWKPYAIKLKYKEALQLTPNSLKLLNR